LVKEEKENENVDGEIVINDAGPHHEEEVE
jgi:hypothetical protein